VACLRRVSLSRGSRDQHEQGSKDLVIRSCSGPTFELAETLKDSSIPLVFVAGYDQAVVPKRFDYVQQPEKPVELWQIVAAIAKRRPDDVRLWRVLFTRGITRGLLWIGLIGGPFTIGEFIAHDFTSALGV
jgi:hypothetical protein